MVVSGDKCCAGSGGGAGGIHLPAPVFVYSVPEAAESIAVPAPVPPAEDGGDMPR